MTAPVSKHHLLPVLPAAFSPAPADVRAAAPASVLSLLCRGLDALRARRTRARVANELSGLTDHELADIGLTRSNIPQVFDRRFLTEWSQRG